MAGFDPYHKWLGIPPKDQPPHHYRLLAIDLFESDPDVIDSAADKQMTYLRSCASGPHVALSQKLLNEVAAARICLLNSGTRIDYDANLKRTLVATASDPQQPVFRLPAVTAATVVAPDALSQQPAFMKPASAAPGIVFAALGASSESASSAAAARARSRPWRDRHVQIGACVAGLLGMVAGFILLLSRNEPTPKVRTNVARTKPSRAAENKPEKDTGELVAISLPVAPPETAPASMYSEKSVAEKTKNNFPVRNDSNAAQAAEIPGNVPAAAPIPVSTTKPQTDARVAVDFAGAGAGQEWSGNGLNMKFCWCPPTTYTMGSTPNEPGRGRKEDQVEVTLTRGFWLGKFEVTQGEWEQLMGTTVRQEANKGGAMKNFAGQGSDFPMYYVSHDDAAEFCRKLTEQERLAGRLPAGWQFRLPTEAEWEYACRAGTTTPFSFGIALNGNKANCNGQFPYATAKKGTNLKKAKPVGSFKPNAFGLFDMHGNVWEWCRDSYSENESTFRTFSSKSVVDPQGRSGGAYRVLRGGGWDSNAVACRSANRFANPPTSRFNIVGFRVACER